MSWIQAPLVTFIIFYFVYMLFELFVHRSERKMLIMKIGELGNVDLSKILAPYMNSPVFKLPRLDLSNGKNYALRIGLCTLGIGLGLLVGICVCRAFSRGNIYDMGWEERSTITTACVCVFGGIALIVAYIIERKNGKEDLKETIESMENLKETKETMEKNVQETEN